ncbi:MAG: glycosyltransferase family 2 protein [Pseudomonadota bacterium]
MNLADVSLQSGHRHLAHAVHRPDAMGPQHVVVLLALYNGQAHLDEQLQSLEAQDHKDWSLVVSDDGSGDGGLARVVQFARDNPHRNVTINQGPRAGFAQNFLSLLRATDPSAPFVAFCDQDDVWLPQKLGRALGTLGDQSRPSLYGGRTYICSEGLERLGMSPLFSKPPSFGNALVQSLSGGNTMVFNRAALEILHLAARAPIRIVSHDWWAYQVISGAGGDVHYDREAFVLYRQHDTNLVGANTGARARFQRLRRLLGGQLVRWTDTNITALKAAMPVLTAQNAETLRHFSDARNAGPWRRLRMVLRLKLTRQTIAGQIALLGAAILGKL